MEENLKCINLEQCIKMHTEKRDQLKSGPKKIAPSLNLLRIQE